MSLFYFTIFAGIGAYAPYLSLHLHRLGLSATEIGILMAVSPFVGLMTQPLWGLVTDWRQDRRSILMLMLTGTATTCIFFLGARSAWVLGLLLGLMALFQGALMPIADSMALDEAARNGGDYAGRRLWGSLGFALAAWAAGWFFTRTSLTYMFIWYSAFLGLTWVIVWRMDRVPEKRRPWKSPWSGLRQLREARGLLTFLAVAFLAQVATQSHNAFFSIYLDALHAKEAAVGFTWTLAALIEIPVFRYVGRLTRWFGSHWGVALGFALLALRFFLYSVARTPEQVFAVQLLAGIYFGVFQASAVALVRELTPESLHATGQTLYAAIAGGLASIVGNLVGGRVVDGFGPTRFYQVNAGLVLAALVLYVGFVASIKGQKAEKAALPTHMGDDH